MSRGLQRTFVVVVGPPRSRSDIKGASQSTRRDFVLLDESERILNMVRVALGLMVSPSQRASEQLLRSHLHMQMRYVGRARRDTNELRLP